MSAALGNGPGGEQVCLEILRHPLCDADMLCQVDCLGRNTLMLAAEKIGRLGEQVCMEILRHP